MGAIIEVTSAYASDKWAIRLLLYLELQIRKHIVCVFNKCLERCSLLIVAAIAYNIMLILESGLSFLRIRCEISIG